MKSTRVSGTIKTDESGNISILLRSAVYCPKCGSGSTYTRKDGSIRCPKCKHDDRIKTAPGVLEI